MLTISCYVLGENTAKAQNYQSWYTSNGVQVDIAWDRKNQKATLRLKNNNNYKVEFDYHTKFTINNAVCDACDGTIVLRPGQVSFKEHYFDKCNLKDNQTIFIKKEGVKITKVD